MNKLTIVLVAISAITAPVVSEAQEIVSTSFEVTINARVPKIEKHLQNVMSDEAKELIALAAKYYLGDVGGEVRDVLETFTYQKSGETVNVQFPVPPGWEVCNASATIRNMIPYEGHCAFSMWKWGIAGKSWKADCNAIIDLFMIREGHAATTTGCIPTLQPMGGPPTQIRWCQTAGGCSSALKPPPNK